ncbi:MAG: M48 family metallopeptidase [Anaerolineales bacterium]
MTEEEIQLDPEKQEQARNYARIRRRLMAFEMLLSTVYLILWLAVGWHRQIQPVLEGWFGAGIPWWLRLLLTAAVIGLPYAVITAPISYYSGFVLPHRFDLSTQSLQDWLIDQIKGMAVSLALGLPLLVGLYAVIRNAPETWWLWAAGLYTLVTAVLAALAPVLLLPIFFNVEPLSEDYETLRQRLIRLARSASTKIEGVFEIDMSRRTKAANAALTGLGKTRRILLGDTLLEEFSEDEIETILAHELAHHVHGDIPLSIAVQSLLNFVSFLVLYLGFRALLPMLGLTSQADPAGLPLVALLLGAFALVTMPLTNAYSRWRERLADEYALNLTRKPKAFASAMTQLANQNLAEADPEAWVVWLLYSHPPLKERIARAVQKQAYFEFEAVGADPVGPQG